MKTQLVKSSYKFKRRESDLIKTEGQIQLVLESVKAIAIAALNRRGDEAEQLASGLISKLEELKNYEPTGDKTIDLYRGDFKISPSVFKQEIEAAGFEVEDEDVAGPVETIGGMRIYTLRKAS